MADAPLPRRHVLTLAGGMGLALASAGLRPTASTAETRPAAAPPLPELPPRGDRRLVAISDLNSGYGSTTYIPPVHRAVALIPALAPDLVLCGGDMVAGQKRGLTRAQLAAMWAAFGQQLLTPLRLAGLPLAFTLGNHDASGSRWAGGYRFALDRQEADRFWQPRRHQLGLRFVDADHFPFAYSVLQHEIFLLVWDASTAEVPAEQLAWAERSLASPAARNAQVRLVMGHLPLRAVAQGREGPGDVLHAAASVQRLLERGGVQTYLSGHQHAYAPARSGALDLLALGALGSGPRRLLGSSDPPRHSLTLIDLFWGRGGQPARASYCAYDMTTLERIS